VFAKILLAIDGSDHSREATVLTRQMAVELKSEVVVFHVQEKIPTRAGSLETDIEDADIHDRVAAELKSEGVSARPDGAVAFHGHVANRIIEAAGQHQADVIIMGSRGLTDITSMFLGSVTHKVLHMAECPVLVAR
jgi:nucleotide-binding universal stress UspA family protein